MSRIRWITPFAILLAVMPPTIASDARPLTAPEIRGGPALWTVLATRRSIRAFGPRAPNDAQVAQLLWAGQGTIDYHRTAPSAGGLYPLTMRVVDANGVWRYVSDVHRLEYERWGDRRQTLALAAFGQDSVRAAPAILVITADASITAAKYGAAAAQRFVALEAGHAAQNVLLAATALDLAAVPVGAFSEEQVRRALELPDSATPLYLLPVGTRPELDSGD